MKTLYFECNMGAAGDMLMASLLELHDDPGGFINRFNTIGLEVHGVRITMSPSSKCGIAGAQIVVTVNGAEEVTADVHDHMDVGGHTHDNKHAHEHHHDHGENHDHTPNHHHHPPSVENRPSNMRGIENILNSLRISETVKKDALEVYQLIAEAEKCAHGVPVSEIHFHEVGNMDAIADIVGVCALIEELAPALILASPVGVGSGQVRCAHGILPVPAPATAIILKDVPIFSGNIRGELCTPTGAALLKHFVKKFDVMPVMTVSAIGYGMGKKDFEHPNCVRAFMGETSGTGTSEEVTELICNLDDMTPEAIAFVQQLLLDEGALDVYTTPIGMKKSRSGIMFTCMCSRESADKMAALIFKHTTTVGIRESISRRYVLDRKLDKVSTKYGDVRIKTAYGYGVTKSKPEYEDVARIARKNNLALADVMDEIKSIKGGF